MPDGPHRVMPQVTAMDGQFGTHTLMERLGIATSAEVEPDTLADRLLAELTAENGIVVWPPMIGAWSHIAP